MKIFSSKPVTAMGGRLHVQPVELDFKKTVQAFVQPITETNDMIKPEDFDFRFTADSHWQWVETIALPFHIPEANINGGVYL